MQFSASHKALAASGALATLALAAVPALLWWVDPAHAARLGSVALPVALLLVAAMGIGLRSLNRLLAAQRAQSLRFHTAIENISQGLCFFDGQTRLIVCNRRFAEMYGLSPEQTRPGTTLREIVDHRFAAGTTPEMTRDEYLAWRAKVAVSSSASDTVAVLRNGRIFAIHHKPMPDGGWVATHEDITDRRRAQAQIEQLARSDALTGLANRMAFREHLEALLRQRSAAANLAVLFIDLDHFKAVNDTLGHPAGDALLRTAAARLVDCVRQGDLVARLGGDEFAIVQSGGSPVAPRALAERLVQGFNPAFMIDGHRVQVGVSVGVALAPQDGEEVDDLLMKADLALYEAKQAGRSTHRFFRADMVAVARGRRSVAVP